MRKDRDRVDMANNRTDTGSFNLDSGSFSVKEGCSISKPLTSRYFTFWVILPNLNNKNSVIVA